MDETKTAEMFTQRGLDRLKRLWEAHSGILAAHEMFKYGQDKELKTALSKASIVVMSRICEAMLDERYLRQKYKRGNQ
jgi:hypothetical protein